MRRAREALDSSRESIGCLDTSLSASGRLLSVRASIRRESIKAAGIEAE